MSTQLDLLGIGPNLFEMSPGLRIAIAEDDALSLKRLHRLLEECGCTVVATFSDGLALEDWMCTHPHLDALFLDVQMPNLDGFTLKASLDISIPVVFVSAFSEHAVQAFDLDATDFILKPLSKDRLLRALDRVRRQLSPREPKSAETGRLVVYAGEGMIFLELSKLTHFEVVESCVFACVGDKRFRTRWRTLGEVETQFPQAGLLRIHRHLLIRPETVVGIRSSGGGARVKVRLAGNVELEASRGATPALKALLGLMDGGLLRA